MFGALVVYLTCFAGLIALAWITLLVLGDEEPHYPARVVQNDAVTYILSLDDLPELLRDYHGTTVIEWCGGD